MVWWRYPGSTPKGLILQIPPWAQWSTLIHLKTSLNTAPDNPTIFLTYIGDLPDNPIIFGAPESVSEFLRGVWGVLEDCLRVVMNFWRCLAVSSGICRCLVLSEGVLGGFWVYLGDILGCLRGIKSGLSQPTILAKLWKARFFSSDSFETSKYQNLPM